MSTAVAVCPTHLQVPGMWRSPRTARAPVRAYSPQRPPTTVGVDCDTGYVADDHCDTGYVADDHCDTGYVADDHCDTIYVANENCDTIYVDDDHCDVVYAALSKALGANATAERDIRPRLRQERRNRDRIEPGSGRRSP